jgi:adenine-specific DNA-methyltransferase
MKKAFTNPKPVRLLEHFVPFIIKNSEDIVIDFFSGSCTTAQAVLELNQKDGINRKFIMIQIPEPCDEKSEACKAGYKNIAEIGKERICRVIKKIEKKWAVKAKEAKEKLPGMAEDIPDLDLGFKVFKLNKSNFKVWDGSDPNASEGKIFEQLEMFVDHIDSKSSQEEILYELLLKAGFMPTEKVEKIELADKLVCSIAEGALLICLENEITRDLIDAVGQAGPAQFICLDRGFKGNDQLKANAVQTFAARNQEKDSSEQIVFRTV